MDRQLISPEFVEDAIACLRARGLSPAPFLDAVSGGEGAMSTASDGRLWWLIAQEIDDEFFGLAARPMRPGSFALLCHAVLHTATLEQALQRALLFLSVVLDRPRGRLVVDGGEAQIVLEDDAPRSAFAYRTYWLILMGVACWLVGRRIPLRRLEFACAAPEHRQDYRKFFGAPVQFDRAQTVLGFDAGFLKLPVIRNDKALRQFLREAPANILVRYRHDEGIAARVRGALARPPMQGWPVFEDLAKALHMSPATLRRGLRKDGQSFASIKDELRLAQAQKWLEGGAMSVAEIAAGLGYSEPSAFHRAYRKWTGRSPRQGGQGR